MDRQFAVAEVEGLLASFVETGAVGGGQLDAVLDDGEAGCGSPDTGCRVVDADNLTVDKETLETLLGHERELLGDGELVGEREVEGDEELGCLMPDAGFMIPDA